MKIVVFVLSILLSTYALGECEDLDTSTDIVNDLYLMGEDCAPYMFNSVENFSTLFTDNKFDSVVSELKLQISQYDGTKNIRPLWLYFRAYGFVASYITEFEINDTQTASMVNVVNLFGFVDISILTINTENNNRSVQEWIILATSLRIPHRSTYDTVFNILNVFTVERINGSHANSVIINNIMIFLFRAQEFDHTSIPDIIGNDTRLPTLLANLLIGEIIPSREYIKGNFALELSRLLQYDNILSLVQVEVKRVLDSLESITAVTETSIGLKLLHGSDIYNRDCSAILDTTETICFSTAFKLEIEQEVFSNTIVRNGIEIQTSILIDENDPEDDMTSLITDLNLLQLEFFDLIGSNTPIDEYDTDTLIIKIFPSQDYYVTYMSILFDLDSGSGGLYIERNLTVYTYDRGEENTFTLTELVRHEFTHYLISKYLVPGFFGETEMWANQRLTVFDEGMANFVAGYTYTGTNEFLPLQTMVDRLSDPDLTISTSSNLTYSSNQLFEYSALLIGFLYESRPAVLNLLFNALKDDDVIEYDLIMASISQLDDAGFQTYLDTVRLDVTSKLIFDHGDIGKYRVSTGTFTSITINITALPPNTSGTITTLFLDGVEYGYDRVENYLNPITNNTTTTSIEVRHNGPSKISKTFTAVDGTILVGDVHSDTPPVRWSNLSSRGDIGTGDDVLIGGFVIGGTGSKMVVIRGKSPDLADNSITITNPELTLFSGSTVIDSNDNWKDHPNAHLIPIGLQPTDDNTSVIAIVLAPGAYTAIVSGVDGDTGLGLVEVFEVDFNEPVRLTNMSTRGAIGTNDSVLIGGLIVTGDSPKKMVIRAKGPSLAEFGVDGVLMDPVITLFSGSKVIDSSDNWKDHIRSSQIPEYLHLTNDSESAIYTELPPGAYTAIVSGVGGGTGVGLIEMFEVVDELQ